VKPAAFEYDEPTTVDETLDLLDKYGDDCKILAGGQSLVPMMNFRLAKPTRLIDINRVESLSRIDRDGDCLTIGALTRHATVEHSPEVAKISPLLTQAIEWVGHSQIRNRGTVGGSAAHADPAAELPAAFAALDAQFRARSRRGERVLGWQDFFISTFITALRPDELLVAVDVPIQPSATGTAFVEFARRHGDFALGGAAVTLSLDQAGLCTHLSIALLAAGGTPVRRSAAEQLLLGDVPTEPAIRDAARAAVEGLHPTSDLHGSSEYRVGLLSVMTERALTQAVQRARSVP
jgi:6-hydroxypseudooxynicotine dehydrogenase subunit alpha